MPPRHSSTLPTAYNHFETSDQAPNIFFSPGCPAHWLQLASLHSSPGPLHSELLRYSSVSRERKPHLVPGASKLPSHLAHPVTSPPAPSVPAICPLIPCAILCGCLFWHPHSRKMDFLNWSADQPCSALLAVSPLFQCLFVDPRLQAVLST